MINFYHSSSASWPSAAPSRAGQYPFFKYGRHACMQYSNFGLTNDWYNLNIILLCNIKTYKAPYVTKMLFVAIRPESRFLPIPHLHSTPPLAGFQSEYRHPVWHGKTRMAWLPDGEKKLKDIFIHFGATHERDRQTDRRTDTACRHIPRVCIASRGKNIRKIKPRVI